MSDASPAALDPVQDTARLRWVAPVTILLGSATALIPVVASIPILPPFGLMLLICWRLLRPDLLPPWSPLLFGLFDDSLSGQPLGSAMLLWTLCFLTADVIDSRLVWRDFWHNWAIGAGSVILALAGGRLIASPLGARVDTLLLVQIILSVALLPAVFRLCASLARPRRRL